MKGMIHSIEKNHKVIVWWWFFPYEKSIFQEPVGGRCSLYKAEKFPLSDLEFRQKLKFGEKKIIPKLCTAIRSLI